MVYQQALGAMSGKGKWCISMHKRLFQVRGSGVSASTRGYPRQGEMVYQQAVEAIKDDVTFILSFIPVTRIFDFTQKQEDAIFNDLSTKFPGREETWTAVARRCLEDMTTPPGHSPALSHNIDGFSEKEYQCFQVFEDAVSQVQTEAMWTAYLRVCLERIGETSPKLVQERRIRKVLEVFKRAAGAGLLSAQCYVDWLDTLLKIGSVQEAECVCKESTQRYPAYVALWRQRLVLLTKGLAEEKLLMDILHQARKLVPERECWPLWEITLEYLVSTNYSSVETLFQTCASSPVRELCLPAKEMYLKWAAVTHGVEKARQVYYSLIRPVSLEFYQYFLDIENSQATPKIKKLRKIYENAVQDYGSENTDLWLDYVKLELNHPKGKSRNAGNIHFRAMKSLSGDQVERFVTQYTLLQAGHDI
ncbi:U3 small nucleolar RNA-associated protein 6 homolog [Liolophura sinensis]|uniref:U3 small nucleolar RNA-associated protein 6 homolog n=1 Tax=Liolophura sinensis TaxID=3198878 RepID=UPI003158E694